METHFTTRKSNTSKSTYTQVLQNTTPTDEMTQKMWKETKASIWTKQTKEGITSRTEISQDRLGQPIKYGGL